MEVERDSAVEIESCYKSGEAVTKISHVNEIVCVNGLSLFHSEIAYTERTHCGKGSLVIETKKGTCVLAKREKVSGGFQKSQVTWFSNFLRCIYRLFSLFRTFIEK